MTKFINSFLEVYASWIQIQGILFDFVCELT